MRVFIVGGRGFVGSAMARYCRARRISHEIVDLDTYSDFVGQSCDVLINADGNSNKIIARQEPLKDFDLSVKSVRDTLSDFSFTKYVYFSSCDVYAEFADPKMTAEDVIVGTPQQSTYGFHKSIAENLVRRCADQWLILRFGGFVGPGLKKNAVSDLLHGRPLWVDLDSKYQYMSTDDAAAIVFRLIDLGLTQQVYNVCGDGCVMLRQVAQWLGAMDTVTYATDQPRLEHYEINIDKIKSVMEVPKTSRTVKAFIDDCMQLQKGAR